MKKPNLKNITEQILEPFALGVLALIFILPIITVMNLTPLTQKLSDLNVLGVNTGENISIDLVGGKHEIFSSEDIQKIEDDHYQYTTIINKRESDIYSKPILIIRNRNTIPQTISLSGSTETNTKSEISVKLDKDEYILQDYTGQTTTQDIHLLPSEEIPVFLSVENISRVQFSETFTLQITTK